MVSGYCTSSEPPDTSVEQVASPDVSNFPLNLAFYHVHTSYEPHCCMLKIHVIIFQPLMCMFTDCHLLSMLLHCVCWNVTHM